MNPLLAITGGILWLAGANLFAVPTTNVVLTITAAWRYTTNNVDAATWTASDYDDQSWSGPSNALFYIEAATLPAPKNTPLPASSTGGPMPCYYLRTSFDLTNRAQIISLIFSNLVDDGAVFYLNGSEIQRVRMDAGVISYTNLANNSPSGGDATAFQSFALTGGSLTNLVPGTNVLAVRVHQHATNSSDVVFGSALAVVSDPEAQPQLTRGPYLQVCTPWSIVVRWRTDLPEDSLLVWGTNLSALGFTNENAAPVTEHQLVLTNLAPDTFYYYAIGSTDRLLAGLDATCYFRTHPLPGTPMPLHIWVIGDAGTGTVQQRAVRDAFYQLNGTNFINAWLQLGDNAYETGTDAEYQLAVFDMYSDLLRHTVTWPTMGNHETYSTDPNGLFPYLNIFTLPTNGVAGGVPSGTKLYYSYDLGMVHLVCLDSMSSSRATNAAMATWLQADLAATTNRWLIAYWHHPPYSKGVHDSDEEIELIEMRQNFLPILEAGGVDLVLCGHSHSYERSYLLDGHYGFSTNLTSAMILNKGSGRETNGVGAYIKPENYLGNPLDHRGAVYAVAGCGGHVSGGTLDHPAMFISLNVLGSMILDITTNRLDAIFLRETGQTNDCFTIIKTNYAPVASNLDFTINGDAATNLLLTASDVNRNPLTVTTNTLPTNGLISAFDTATGTLTYTPAWGSTNNDRFGFVASDGQLTSTAAVVTIHISPPADRNQNGLPDAWEAAYGITDPNADADGDGATNLQEYRAGTNPTNALSWLRMMRINGGQAGFQIVWSSVGATRYRVLFSDGDTLGGFNGVFTPIARPVTDEMDPDPVGTPGTMSFTDDFTLTGGPPTQGGRYYRVEVLR